MDNILNNKIIVWKSIHTIYCHCFDKLGYVCFRKYIREEKCSSDVIGYLTAVMKFVSVVVVTVLEVTECIAVSVSSKTIEIEWVDKWLIKVYNNAIKSFKKYT